ncbi:amino acid adenylation domain-containing protein [Nonomuraea sp. NPDC049141]|uniref:non-ribosomal peptide synthetase n=1 Tax=Nonomuraea sp. NPDC049141 TaxID=3155500 RepID=UPI0033ED1CB1
MQSRRFAALPDLVRAQARRTPDAIAVQHEGTLLDYATLDLRVSRMTARLRAAGVGRGDFVGVLLERDAGLLVALLAVHRAGAAYVPLDPSHPPARISRIAADAGLRLLVTTRAHESLGLPSLYTDDPNPLVGDHEAAAIALDPQDIAYLLYTSGSTGEPKGVLVTHGAVANLMASMLAWPGLTASDVLPAVTTAGFDISVAELFLPLVAGARVVIGSAEQARDPRLLGELLDAAGATHLQATPTSWRMLLDSGWRPPPGFTAWSGGEKLEADLADRLRESCAVVWNLYGPTETTVWSAGGRLPGGPADPAHDSAARVAYDSGGGSVHDFSAFAATSLYVLDDDLEPADEGELYIGGAGLARGYLGRPALTADRFVPDPYVSGARMYRSGDVARRTADGRLEILGRTDHQVKIRGHRVEPGEIEAALRTHPRVRACVVHPFGTPARLAAYVVGRAGQAPPADELRAHLATTLPAYLIPAAFVALPELPVSASGKVDRAALPAPSADRGAPPYAPPVTATEKLVAATWQDVLGVERVGRDDGFLARGGDSLAAAKAIFRASRHAGVRVPLRVLFEAGTVRAFAAWLDEAVAAAALAPVAAAVPEFGGGVAERRVAGQWAPVPAGERAPLSSAQLRLWLLDQMGDGGDAYHVPLLLRLTGRLDHDALLAAVRRLAERHESLRSRYAWDGGEPVQEVMPAEAVTVTVARLPAGRDAETETRAWLQRLLSAGFDLEHAAPCRAGLLQLAPDEHLLALVAHHIAIDGWSLDVLQRDLADLYRTLSTGAEPAPVAAAAPSPAVPAFSSRPGPAARYADHVARQRDRTGDDADLAYWRDRLAGLAPLDLPADRPRPPVWSAAGAALRFEVPAPLRAAVTELAAQHGATPFMALLAAFQVLLGRYAGTGDVAVGTVLAGRSGPEFDEVVGLFVNTVVMRADLSGRPAFAELLAGTRRDLLRAHEHQDLPFERLVQELEPRRDPSRNPLFQVMFAFQSPDGDDPDWGGGLRVSREPRPAGGSTTFDLTVSISDGPDGGWSGYLEYSTALFDEATAARLAAHYRTLLASAVADPSASVAELPVFDGAAAVEGPAGVPAPGTLTDLVDARPPGDLAVICGTERMTYGELAAASDRLARHLVAAGAAPGDLVAVRLPRGVPLLVSMLAVAKAGGHYLAVDPDHPRERVAAMLADARPRLLVTAGPMNGLRMDGVRVVRLDDEAGAIAARPAGRPAVPVTAADPLALVYTSGSTGTPKGVVLTHANVLSAVTGRRAYAEPPCRLMLPVSPTFDVFLSFAAWTLCSGGELLLPPPGPRADLDELARLASEHRPTHVVCGPHLVRALLEHDSAALAAISTVVTGGESCPVALLDELARRAPGLTLINEYGPTEASWGSYFDTAAGPVPTGRAALPIGAPPAGYRIHLWDDGGSPVPLGAAGEIVIGGPGVAQGYHGRPALTAARFVPDPSGPPGARAYRTGDHARLDSGGQLQFLGRVDGQVKIRGHRVELGEIEAVLSGHPDVAQAAARLDAAGRLAGYLVPVPGRAAPDAARLRTYLAERLPEHMIPAGYVSMPELPVTPHGKVDRAALPESGDGALVPARTGTPPRTPIEELVAEVFAVVLGLPGCCAEDSFFDLDGNSLTAAQAVAKVRARLPVTVGVRDLFAAPTVAGFAELLGARMFEALTARGTSDAESPAAGPASEVPAVRRQDAPLSYAQERLWLLDRIFPGGADYVAPIAWRLRGRLDPAALRHALDGLVARHDVLRTRYELRDGEPRQVVDPVTALPLARHDLSRQGPASGNIAPHDLSRPGPAALHDLSRQSPASSDTVSHDSGGGRRLDALLAEEAARGFDLAGEWPLRATLVRLGPDDHVLLLTVHHIACDAWSLTLLADELDTRYRAAAAGSAPDLPPLPAQYADHAVGQRGQPDDAETLRYWRDRLAGLRDLAMPADRPRPPVRDRRGRTLGFRLPGDLAGRVRALARERGATPYMVLLAAFHLLLGRYCGQDDTVVGTPVARRDTPHEETMIGFFVDTVVLRGDLAGARVFGELLDRVRDDVLGAFAYQALPFERLAQELAPERDASRNPLFQVMFSYQNVRATTPRLGALEVSEVPIAPRTAKFDLTLEVAEGRDGTLNASLEYATGLFDRATMEAFAERYVSVLGQVLDDPGRPLDTVDLLTQAERHDLITGWNATAADRPGLPLHGLFERQAAATPGATALTDGTRTVTYAELDTAAGALARRLRAAGIGAESLVAVALPRGTALVVTLLGVLKAGAAYVPLDPGHPAERLTAVLRESRAAAIVTDGDLAARLTTRPPLVIPPPTLHAHLAPDAPPALDPAPARGASPAPAGASGVPRVDLDAPAYAIFTSGSTGTPKGVVITHRGIVNRVLWTVRRHGLTAADRVLQKTTIAFDAAGWEIFAPLAVGGTVVLASPGAERDPALMVADAATHGVTVLQAVPSMLGLLAEEPGLSGCAALRLVFSAGEPLTADLCARLAARVPAELYNTYGPTECSIDVTAWPYRPGVTTGGHLSGKGTVPIGGPIDNTVIRVLDAESRLVPTGVPGELCVAGDGLARGYLHNPAQTAARFVPDPYGPPGGRVYRTGDLARWRADGAIDFLGRLDHQVKVRGVRVEPGEVEAVLAAHPDVTAAAVAAGADPHGDTRLIAYVLPASRADLSVDKLRLHLSERLPEPMVPDAVVVLDRFPYTPSGKLDRAALPAPDAALFVPRGGEYVAPRDPAEEVIASVFADVLGLERVGVHDSFFAAGGNSMLAMRAVSRLRETFPVPVTLGALLDARTVAELARRLSAAQPEPPGPPGPVPAQPPAGIAPAGAASTGPVETASDATVGFAPGVVGVAGEHVPLSAAQRRMWLMYAMDPADTEYLAPIALRLRGTLDEAALLAAVESVRDRHAVLRTRYEAADGEPRQVVDPPAPLKPYRVDLSGRPDPERQAAELVERWAARPFDLAAEAPLRVALARIGTDDHVLLLLTHHIACDGRSLDVIARELGDAYNALRAGERPAPEPLPVQYTDYAIWENGPEAGQARRRRLARWRAELADVPALDLPLDRPRPPVRDSRGAVHAFRIPAGVARSVLGLGRERAATPFMTWLAAFQALLGRYTGRTSFLVGAPVAGRDLRAVENLVGCFVNTMLTRADLSGEPDFGTLVDRAREGVLAALDHRDVPLEDLVDALGVERDLSRVPLLDAMLAVEDTALTPYRLDGLAVGPFPVTRRAAMCDLTLTLGEGRDGEWTAEFEYAATLFEPGTVARLAEHFLLLLGACAADPTARPSDVRLVDVDLPDEPFATPLVAAAVADWARRTPGAVALTEAGGDGGTYTYAELDRLSGHLAARLVAAGVRPGECVASCLPRGSLVAVSLLGILRAGGVYVPVDADSPPERLAALLADITPAAVVTDGSAPPSGSSVTDLRMTGPSGSGPFGSGPSESSPSGSVVAVPVVAEGVPPDVALPEPDPGDLAYMIFTSGSTGRPKGVQVEHGSYAQHCVVQARAYGLEPGDAFALMASVTFDASLDQIAATLMAGATVVVADPRATLPGDLADQLTRSRVTVLDVTPAYYRELVAALRPGDGRLAGLRLMSVGGDAVTYADAAMWAATGLPAGFHTGYGPTEATIATTAHTVTDLGEPPDALVPLGRPLPGTGAYVLDTNLSAVPHGVVGELYIGGSRVARGYHRAPALTAARFLPDPYAPLPGARMYASGDLVRRRADGTIEFVGRADRQIKIRGFRIEPGEIEAVLATCPGLRTGVVEARRSPLGDLRLVGYVVAEPGLTPADLAAHLRERLPDYMVPAAWVELPALPHTPNGKTDRKALPDPDWSRPQPASRYTSPRTEMEEYVADLWATVLGLERVGRDDDFFVLGGNSLLASRVLLRLREAFDLPLSLRQIFEARTVAALGELLENAITEEISHWTREQTMSLLSEGDQA